MKAAADVGIIGGGIIGSAIGYYLTKMGLKDIVLFEKDYLTSGCTGRCGGGIRQQWSTSDNVKLAKRSVELFEKYEDELDFDFEYIQQGYLILAFTDDEVRDFKKNVAMQKKHGLKVDLISPRQAKKIVPFLNTNDVLAATYCPTDGLANPFLTTFGYAERASEGGMTILRKTRVNSIERKGGSYRIRTDKGDCTVKYIVNAAGPWAQEAAKMIGYDIPVEPERHQILVTEPLERMVCPMVVDFYHGFYGSQEKRGGFVMGESDPSEPVSYKTSSHWKFVESISKKFTYLFPRFSNVKILRQWAGSYCVSPDAQPILGPISADDPNYFLAVGYSGHGFMLAPATGEAIAEWIVKGKPLTTDISHLTMERIEKGDYSQEYNVV
ncbi:FAD-binding oxidoreductase [bacterium]|nr:FAD-binding oxidoreductase [bacterium]